MMRINDRAPIRKTGFSSALSGIGAFFRPEFYFLPF